MKNQGHELVRKFPEKHSLRAQITEHDGKPHVAVQWLNAGGKPQHQALLVPMEMAPSIFGMLSAFVSDPALAKQTKRK